MITEHEIQSSFIRWTNGIEAEKECPEARLIFAIPNAGKRSIGAAKYYKAEGLKAGFPDLFLPVARKGYHGMFIEFKRSKNDKLRDNQRQWKKDLEAQGYYHCIVWSVDMAIEETINYLKDNINGI